MKRHFLLVVYLAFSVDSYGEVADISIAEVRGNEVRQLTSDDWEANKSKGCLIEVAHTKEVTRVLSSEREVCSNYVLHRRELLSEGVRRGTSLGYGLLVADSSCPGRFILPEITEYKNLPVVPSYVDLEEFKHSFKQDVLAWHLANPSPENGQAKEFDIELIQKGGFPEIYMDLTDFSFPQGGGRLHNLRLYLLKSVRSGETKVAIANYWVRVYSSSDYVIIHQEVENKNWFDPFRDKQEVGVFDRVVGPYTTINNYYFIHRSLGVESNALELFRYPRWGEFANKAIRIAEWVYGC